MFDVIQKMEVSVRELIRETKNAVNARFDMLEHVLNISSSSKVQVQDNSKVYELLHQQNDEIDSIKTMMYRFNDLIANIMRKIETMEQKPVVTPLPSLSELLPHLEITPKPHLTARSHHDNDSEDSIAKGACSEEYCDNCGSECDGVEEVSGKKALEQMRERELDIVDDNIVQVTNTSNEEEEEVEEEVEEELVEEEAEEELVEEDAEEDAEEEEGIELEEFEYKGMTLYRDTENKVYRMDEDGALSEPLGLWDEPKQRIKKL